MTDITLCTNSECRKRKKCYRYMAKPNDIWQSFGNFHEDTPNIPCHHFIKIHRDATKRS